MRASFSLNEWSFYGKMDPDAQISVLSYDITSVGRHFRATKKKHSWRFLLHRNSHQIDLYASAISGKKRVVIDGELKFDGKSPARKYFQYLDSIEGVMISLEQTDLGWELMLGARSFGERLGRAPGKGTFRGVKEEDLWAKQPKQDDFLRFSHNGPLQSTEEPLYHKIEEKDRQTSGKSRFSSAPRASNPPRNSTDPGNRPKEPSFRDLHRPAEPQKAAFRPVADDILGPSEVFQQVKRAMPPLDGAFPQNDGNSTAFRPFQTVQRRQNQPIRARPLLQRDPNPEKAEFSPAFPFSQ